MRRAWQRCSWPQRAPAVTLPPRYLMGMSFMISLNMDGDTIGSQLLGSRGSVPLSTTFRSSIQRLKDSRGGSIPEREAQSTAVKARQGPCTGHRRSLSDGGQTTHLLAAGRAPGNAGAASASAGSGEAPPLGEGSAPLMGLSAS